MGDGSTGFRSPLHYLKWERFKNKTKLKTKGECVWEGPLLEEAKLYLVVLGVVLGKVSGDSI